MEQPSFLNHAKVTLQTFFNKLNDLRLLAWFETQLAGQSAIKILILYCLLILSALVTYFFGQVILFVYITRYTLSLISSLFIMFAINFLICLGIMLRIRWLKHDLTFSATRKQLALLKSNLKETANESS